MFVSGSLDELGLTLAVANLNYSKSKNLTGVCASAVVFCWAMSLAVRATQDQTKKLPPTKTTTKLHAPWPTVAVERREEAAMAFKDWACPIQFIAALFGWGFE